MQQTTSLRLIENALQTRPSKFPTHCITSITSLMLLLARAHEIVSRAFVFHPIHMTFKHNVLQYMLQDRVESLSLTLITALLLLHT